MSFTGEISTNGPFWSIKGRSKIMPDVYDFDQKPPGHRSRIGEYSTTMGKELALKLQELNPMHINPQAYNHIIEGEVGFKTRFPF